MADQGAEMTGLVVEECHDKMSKAIVHLKDEFAAVRTGRASSSLVEISFGKTRSPSPISMSSQP